ncbi:F-box domain [Macleaya cordata]|uniref:F-box domain n=1 Tax=Macleaya cordata TaxID=56857 RepID=A0A200Q0Y7_MACCD|nr:F-box domain [Macleaya cordata]
MDGMKKKKYYFFLPEEIIIDILSRLPVKSVLQCRLVCKAWRSLVCDPSFAHMHLLRRRRHDDDHGKVNIAVMTLFENNSSERFHYTLDNENCEKSYEIRSFDFSSDDDLILCDIVGSCNGLICIADYKDDGSLYIFNPITRECLNLPNLINQSSCLRIEDMVYGFGYLPSTNEYKVVRICYYEHFAGRVQVYTLGAGSGWRDKGEITYSLIFYPPEPTILANGALHWRDGGEIVAFDLADEEFLLLPTPPCSLLDSENDQYPFQLQVLGGRLCVVHCKNEVSVEVWSLKKNEKNGNYGDIKGQKDYQFWSWIKEFDVDSDLEARDPTPLALTMRGEVLLYNRGTLFRYDLKTATSEKLVDIGKYLSACRIFEAVPHWNSFVSLKALGEEDTKIIESAS